MHYQCPLCQRSLRLDNQVWRCCNNHHFDRAKEGYVNLMPVQYKKSKNPGDNQMMMQARRQFLDAGYYQALRDSLFSLLDNLFSERQGPKTLLDIGCGEGYYTGFLAEKLVKNHDIDIYGLDIAKNAIRLAAKRYSTVSFCVASSYRLPFDNESMDGILRIYAPCKAQELYRVIKKNGFIVTVTPGSYHLYQLKKIIYQTPVLHRDDKEEIEGFRCVNSQRLKYEVELSNKQAINLLHMTPFAWRASENIINDLLLQTRSVYELDFNINVYKKEH